MKSYTDIEQSKKLAEILPLESADMCYPLPCEDGDKPLLEQGEFGSTPCWSLAALLDYLRKIELFPSMETDGDEVIMYISCYNADGIYTIDTKAADFVDAYCDMIIKLHELKLL